MFAESKQAQVLQQKMRCVILPGFYNAKMITLHLASLQIAHGMLHWPCNLCRLFIR